MIRCTEKGCKAETRQELKANERFGGAADPNWKHHWKTGWRCPLHAEAVQG